MRYLAYWWGIRLVADDEEEEQLLRDLHKRLENPSERVTYDDGEVKLYEEGELKSEYRLDHRYNDALVLELGR